MDFVKKLLTRSWCCAMDFSSNFWHAFVAMLWTFSGNIWRALDVTPWAFARNFSHTLDFLKKLLTRSWCCALDFSSNFWHAFAAMLWNLMRSWCYSMGFLKKLLTRFWYYATINSARAHLRKNILPVSAPSHPKLKLVFVLGNGVSRTLMSLTCLWLLETNSSSGEGGQDSREFKRQTIEIK